MCSLLQASPPPLQSKYSQIKYSQIDKISPSHNLMKHHLSPFLQKEGTKHIVRKSHSVRDLESKEPPQEVAYI
jgi:hypothetical protein